MWKRDYFIDIEKFKKLLSFDGITLDMSDEDLELFIETKLSELEAFVGFTIRPYERTKIVSDFNGDICELNFYPVVDIVNVYVDDVILTRDHYNLNFDLGIVYFDEPLYHSVIRILYLSGLKERVFYSLIVPLLKDMIAYTVDRANAHTQFGGLNYVASSLKEGDVSISFGNGGGSGRGDYGYNANINSRIDDLRNRYMTTCRVRLL